MVLKIGKDFAQKNPNFYISFGVDERTGISVSGLNYVLIKVPRLTLMFGKQLKEKYLIAYLSVTESR